VRALQKAGLSNLIDLREASLEQLCAVPGMSEIKARQVQTYLAQFAAGALAAADRRRATVRPVARRDGRGADDALLRDSRLARARERAVCSECMLSSAALRALERASALLLMGPAADYRGRLLRELARLLTRAFAALEVAEVSDRAHERALRGLQAAVEAVEATLERPDLDRKAQLRLAETLSDTNERLDALLGRPATTENLEEADD
jgi:hypothetical protein